MTCNFQRTSLDLFQIHWILAVFTIEYDLICIYGDYVPSSILLQYLRIEAQPSALHQVFVILKGSGSRQRWTDEFKYVEHSHWSL